MTETNKKRVMKYRNLLRRIFELTFEDFSNYMKIDINADYVYRTAINCAIAEVEAMIEELKIRNLTYAYHESELAELKSMLQ